MSYVKNWQMSMVEWGTLCYIPANMQETATFVFGNGVKIWHLDKETATIFGMIAGVERQLGKFVSMLEEDINSKVFWRCIQKRIGK